jgi:hypothetical protein
MANKKIKKYVQDWMKTYEPDIFISNKHGQYVYNSENLASSLNIVCFFEDLIESYEYDIKISNHTNLLPKLNIGDSLPAEKLYCEWDLFAAYLTGQQDIKNRNAGLQGRTFAEWLTENYKKTMND